VLRVPGGHLQDLHRVRVLRQHDAGLRPVPRGQLLERAGPDVGVRRVRGRDLCGERVERVHDLRERLVRAGEQLGVRAVPAGLLRAGGLDGVCCVPCRDVPQRGREGERDQLPGLPCKSGCFLCLMFGSTFQP